MIYETEVCIHLNDKKVDPTKIIRSLRLALHIVKYCYMEISMSGLFYITDKHTISLLFTSELATGNIHFIS